MTMIRSLLPAVEESALPLTGSTTGRRFWLGHRSYWLCQLAGWGGTTVLGIWGDLLKPQLEGMADEGRRPLLVVLASPVTGVILTHICRWIILQWRWKDQALSALIPRILLTGLICGALLAAVVLPLDPFFWPRAQPGLILLVLVMISLQFITWQGCYFGYHYYRQLQETRLQQLKMDVSVKETALASLRSQVNPHFLFNGLNTLRDLIGTDPAKARAVVTQLAKLFRASLASGTDQLIPLSQEIETVEAYLLIEKTRFEDRLPLRSRIDPEALHCQVPPFLLQTLVENAVKYGVNSDPQPWGVEYHAGLEQGALVLTVKNRGRWEEVKPSSSTGLGLKMARERLALLFDVGASLTIDAGESGWITARATIPQTPPLL